MTIKSPKRGRPPRPERDQRPQGTSVYSLLDAPPTTDQPPPPTSSRKEPQMTSRPLPIDHPQHPDYQQFAEYVFTHPAHYAVVPATTWNELCELEPELRRLPRAIQLLWDPGSYDSYAHIRDYASLLVGWGRGHHAPDVEHYTASGGGRFSNFAEMGQDTDHLLPAPLTKAEAFLRTPHAYAIAMTHLKDLLAIAARPRP